MCFEIYNLDPAHFVSASGLAWQAFLKKDQSKIRSINLRRYVINGRKIYQS